MAFAIWHSANSILQNGILLNGILQFVILLNVMGILQDNHFSKHPFKSFVSSQEQEP
jgi:hypothetical protein